MKMLVLWILAAPLVVAGQKPNAVPHPNDGLPEVIWRTPRPTTVEDWTCGPGGCDDTPTPPFQFVREDTSGTTPKVTVRDSENRTWSVKFGAEVIPECFGSRLVTAVGYLAEPTYCLRSGTIHGAQKLRRARFFIGKDGTFSKGRFERRGQSDFEFIDGHTWNWDNNRFRGTRELAGLKIVMMLLSNWDAKDGREGSESNNVVFRVRDRSGTRLFYGVYDWGASLGSWGGVLKRDQSDCAGFAHDTPRFVKRVGPNEIQWGFLGVHASDIHDGITTEDIRWLLSYLIRIPPEHLRAGFKASGATERQTECWARSLEYRIRQLQAVAE